MIRFKLKDQYDQVISIDSLKGKNVVFNILTATECEFCHIEQESEKVIKDIEDMGYHIVEMQNCHLTNFSNRFSYSGFMKAMANLVYLVDIVLIHRYGLKKSKYLL